MNRRMFLSALVGTAGVAMFDPERLLWVPGRKTIFLPPAPGAGIAFDRSVFGMLMRMQRDANRLNSMTFDILYGSAVRDYANG